MLGDASSMVLLEVLLETLDCKGMAVSVEDGEGRVPVGLRLLSLSSSVPYRKPLSARGLPPALLPLPLSWVPVVHAGTQYPAL